MGYKIEKNKVFYNKSSYTRLKELATQSKKETKEITIKDPRLLCFHVLNLKKNMYLSLKISRSNIVEINDFKNHRIIQI